MTAVETREALHTIAEHVLAPARYAVTGRIGLRATPGGFGTPPFPGSGGERQLLVRDTMLVDRHGEDEQTRTPHNPWGVGDVRGHRARRTGGCVHSVDTARPGMSVDGRCRRGA